MSKLTIGGVLLSAAAFAACSNDSGAAGTTTDPFLGTWSCTDQLAITFTSPAGVPMQNVTQMSIMNITGSSGKLTASKEKEGGGSGCNVSFTSNGSSGTLDPGQTCMTEQGITLTYTSGSATVNGSSFNSTFNFEGAGTLTISGMMVAATVTGTQTTSGSRLSAPPTGGSGGGGTTGGW